MRLFVCLDGEVAGTLEMRGSTVRFVYSEAWLADKGAYPVSQAWPIQPTGITGSVVTNFLWGLLPDNERTLDAWARRFQVSARNPVALLSHVGEDCAGAVQFVREDRLDEVQAAADAPPQIEWLDDAQLERRIQHLAQDTSAARESATEGQFSLSGAQAKTALYFDKRHRRWGVPQGRTPTTHILKPVTNEFDAFDLNEHFCLMLARRVGLAAASTECRIIGGVPTLIAERYDRIRREGRWLRIHQEDCCQALGIHPGSKYENQGGPGFAQIMTLLEGTDEPEADRERFMRSACLVYLIAATDAHAKNFSLLYGRGGERYSMRLAPLYDIASAWPYPKQIPVQKMKLAMRIGRHYRWREIQPRHFTELARSCRFSPATLLAILRELATRLPDEASALIGELHQTKITGDMLSGLLDGLTTHCRNVASQLEKAAGALVGNGPP
jgi:serine/threonine-protein kinase HipA